MENDICIFYEDLNVSLKTKCLMYFSCCCDC